MIDYSKFELSLKRLEEQHMNLLGLGAEQPTLICQAVSESVIQRFETCYDCLWKVLKRYLAEELGIAEPPNSPRPLFRLANENGLFNSSLQKWFEYASARISTSHDYDGEKALTCLQLMPNFIDDAISLYQRLTTETWR
ncbi:MAG: nucleotidyltransferase substrate binding protein [Gammaproteobacteria bacterium]|nr:nucleotidyltransferase substrate binding protein [Gammaproteobacteria bacterium]MCY4357468.1 nucleotidyltransferase substrate binding protein [Gammaproteobacteria bacterium]